MVEDNPAEQLSIKELLGHDDIDVTVAATGAEAIQTVKGQIFDCVMRTDLRLPDISGFDVLERFATTPSLAGIYRSIVFTGKELSPEGGCAATFVGA